MTGGGHDTSLTVEDPQGNVIQTTSPPFPRMITLTEPGVYTLKGAISNEAGDTARCEATVARTPTQTQTQTRAWTLRPFAAVLNTSDDEIINRAGSTRRSNGAGPRFVQSAFQTNSGLGGGLGIEYHVTEQWGVEARLLLGFPEARLNVDTPTQWLHDTDDLDLFSLTVGPNYHFYQSERVDLLAGPYVGYASLGDVSLAVDALNVRQERSFEDEFIWGGQIGADIQLVQDSPWKLHLGVMYSDLTAEDERTGEKIDLNPWMFLGGVARDF